MAVLTLFSLRSSHKSAYICSLKKKLERTTFEDEGYVFLHRSFEGLSMAGRRGGGQGEKVNAN